MEGIEEIENSTGRIAVMQKHCRTAVVPGRKMRDSQLRDAVSSSVAGALDHPSKHQSCRPKV